MPRPKAEREVSNDGTLKVIEIETSGGPEAKEPVTTFYTIPTNAEKYIEMALNASDKPDGGAFAKAVFGPARKDQGESPRDLLYRAWVFFVDKTARQMVYEAAANKSTYITIGGERYNVMDFPLEKIVHAVNRKREDRADTLATLAKQGGDPEDNTKVADRTVGYGPWQAAAARLVDQGKAKEVDGKLELVA